MITGPEVPTEPTPSHPVSLVDVFDTLCDLTGIPTPDSVTGQSLFGPHERTHVFSEYGIRDMSKSRKRPAVSKEQLEPYGLGLKCIRTNDHKFVLRSDGETERYALPDEETIG